MSGTVCPYCGTGGSQVKDSRQTADGQLVRRRRRCRGCEKRWTTVEMPVADFANLTNMAWSLQHLDTAIEAIEGLRNIRAAILESSEYATERMARAAERQAIEEGREALAHIREAREKETAEMLADLRIDD